MVRREITVINKLGLHARAAARLVRLTSRYACEIFLECGGEQVNAKSILGILSLAAAKGTALDLLCEGAGEAEAADAVEALFAARFEEAE
jgi:phosphocarrier protein HPr